MPEQIKHSGWLINGQLSDSVPATNRGLAYGDGLFETIRFHGSEPVLWGRHWQRLLRGCQILGLNLPAESETNLLEQCRSLVDQHALTQAVAKIILIRDGIGQGYRFDQFASVQTFVSISTLPEYALEDYLTGINVWLCKTRLAINPQLAGVKHLNRLEQVLATREWSASRYHEGIMLNTSNHIIEGTRSNVFFVKDERLVTPSLEGSGVAGVMREYLLHCSSELGLQAQECPVTLPDLSSFQEAFICNSVFGIWPIVSLEMDKEDAINWTPGEITKSLQQTVSDKLNLKMGIENSP